LPKIAFEGDNWWGFFFVVNEGGGFIGEVEDSEKKDIV